MKKFLVLCLLTTVWILGCGSETSGSLSVSAPTAANGIVTAKAKFTPSSGSSVSGQEISFRWYTLGVSTKTKSAEVSITHNTDSTGTVTSQLTLPTTRTESVTVYVMASTGDLTNIEGWQSVVVAP